MSIIDAIYKKYNAAKIKGKSPKYLFLGYEDYAEFCREATFMAGFLTALPSPNKAAYTWNNLIVKIYKRERYLGLR